MSASTSGARLRLARPADSAVTRAKIKIPLETISAASNRVAAASTAASSAARRARAIPARPKAGTPRLASSLGICATRSDVRLHDATKSDPNRSHLRVSSGLVW